LAGISILLILADQALKWAADAWLRGAGVVRLIGSYVVLVYAQNTGGFLSLGAGIPEPLRIALLIVLPVALLGGFAVVYLRRSELRIRDLAILCLLIGGGLGNIVDRVFRGRVTDYLLFRLSDRIRTGVMNLADLYILGVVIIIMAEILFKKKNEAPKPGGTAPEGR
jgi:signal peptidase II